MPPAALCVSVVQVPRTSDGTTIISQVQYCFFQTCHHSVPCFQLRCCAVPLTSFMLLCIPNPSSRALLHITITILCLLGVAISRPTQNITTYVTRDDSNGTTNPSNNGTNNCFPATSVDIASFLLFNYVAHGATVVSYPGEPAFDTLLSVVAAILFPTFGVIRALNFIVRRPLLTAKNDLEVAARSGANCMLVRSSSWKAQKGDNIRNALIKDPGNEPSIRARSTSHSDPSTDNSPKYVPTYSFSRQIKLRNTPKHCRLVDLQAAVAH